MATNGSLSAGASAGTQTSTQNPQASTQTSGLGQSQTVQTGTAASSLVTNRGGIPLHGTSVPTVNLTAATVTTAPAATSAKHGINPVVFGFSILLFVVAVVLFWTTYRPATVKNTTK